MLLPTDRDVGPSPLDGRYCRCEAELLSRHEGRYLELLSRHDGRYSWLSRLARNCGWLSRLARNKF